MRSDMEKEGVPSFHITDTEVLVERPESHKAGSSTYCPAQILPFVLASSVAPNVL